ncbi:transposase, partial [Corynebacterium liangguodongii]|uniref:transposase n=1 Tax=Corynebacterium liangguodongii TaxID=2079535 RepID=UPI000D60D723
MTTVSPKKNHDQDKVNEISEKLMENPELAKLIGELSTSTDNASDLVKGLLQASINAGLQAEMDAHLGYGHADRKAKARVETAQESNHRNGSYTKTVNSGYGALEVTMPRDRAGTFAPKMVPKGSRRLTELDDMIISLYAGGMTVRDIQHHLATTLGVDMSPDTISTI